MVGEGLVTEIESKSMQIFDREYGCCACISFTKGVYLPYSRNLILNEQNELKNRNLQIDEIEKEAIQSAKQTDMDIPKCKNCTLDCTLEEIAVLNYLKEHKKK